MSHLNKSISVIISAYNEEKNLRSAIADVNEAFRKFTDSVELLVFNDGSWDRTGAIADEVAKVNRNVRVIHNIQNRGVAYIAREGIRLATNDYVTWFPGDNAIDYRSLDRVIKSIGDADIIVAYMDNIRERSLFRKTASRLYTGLMNFLFGLNLKYYNGPTIYPREVLRSVCLTSNGFDFFAELLIRCLKSGCSVKEVPFTNKKEEHGKSKAFSFGNFVSSLKLIFVLFWDINIRKKPKG